MKLRATIVPPSGLRCTAQVVRAETPCPSSAQENNSTSDDFVRSATALLSPTPMTGRFDQVPIDFNTLEWNVWPCKVTNAKHNVVHNKAFTTN